MQERIELGVQALKRLGCYFPGKPRLVFQYRWQGACAVDVYSDADLVWCFRTRKSTSGGCLLMGSQLIKAWSSTQQSITLSSGEAEMVGVTKVAAAALEFQSPLTALGLLWTPWCGLTARHPYR